MNRYRSLCGNCIILSHKPGKIWLMAPLDGGKNTDILFLLKGKEQIGTVEVEEILPGLYGLELTYWDKLSDARAVYYKYQDDFRNDVLKMRDGMAPEEALLFSIGQIKDEYGNETGKAECQVKSLMSFYESFTQKSSADIEKAKAAEQERKENTITGRLICKEEEIGHASAKVKEYRNAYGRVTAVLYSEAAFDTKKPSHPAARLAEELEGFRYNQKYRKWFFTLVVMDKKDYTRPGQEYHVWQENGKFTCASDDRNIQYYMDDIGALFEKLRLNPDRYDVWEKDGTPEERPKIYTPETMEEMMEWQAGMQAYLRALEPLLPFC